MNLHKIVFYTSIALTTIDIAATIAAPLTGGTSLCVAAVAKATAQAANTALNVTDIALNIGSASVDLANAQSQEEVISAAINLGREVSVNVAQILAPKTLESGPVKKITLKLSETAKNAIRKPLFQLSKRKAIAKVISIVKDK